jgi:AcrR family transcriptional regulator
MQGEGRSPWKFRGENEMHKVSREHSRAVTQKKLRQAALRAFAETGFSGASVDRIAESAGFSRGAFYANYKSKHDIMLELLREMSVRETERWRAIIERHGDGQNFLDVVADHYEMFMQESAWGLFAVEAQLLARRDPGFALEYRQYLQETAAGMAQLVTFIFRKAGKQAPDDIGAVTQSFYSLAVGLVLCTDSQNPATGPKAAGGVVARFLQGLLASAPAQN